MRFSVQGDYVFDRASFFFWPFCVKRKSVIGGEFALNKERVVEAPTPTGLRDV